MLLAGDIGGTKTLLGLFAPGADPTDPRRSLVDEFTTLDYDGVEYIILEFLTARGVRPRDLTAATIGVAGAITEQVAHLTNVPWRVGAAAVARAMGLEHVHLLNDLEALAYAIPALHADELAVLQDGTCGWRAATPR
jgi:glucokinase